MPMFTSARQARSTFNYLTKPIPGGVPPGLTTYQLGTFHIKLTSALVTNVIVTFPAHVTEDIGSVWCVENGTTGAFTLTLQNTVGLGVMIVQGKSMLITWNGTNLVPLQTDPASMGAAEV